MGAPIGNRNAAKHDGRSRITLRSMEGRLGPAYTSAKLFRRQVEAAVIERYGGVSITQATLIHSAAIHECAARIWEDWLRDNGADTTPERLAIATDRISRERDRRDRCVATLDLDAPDERTDPLRLLYGDPVDVPSTPATSPEPPADAPKQPPADESTTDADGGDAGQGEA